MKIGFLTIHVKDVQASIDFYEKVAGLKVTRRFSPRPDIEIAFMDDGAGHSVEFIRTGHDAPYSGRGASLGFDVEDMEKTIEHLKTHRVEIVSGPHATPDGTKLLQARDLNGFELGFVQPPKKS